MEIEYWQDWWFALGWYIYFRWSCKNGKIKFALYLYDVSWCTKIRDVSLTSLENLAFAKTLALRWIEGDM